MGVIDSRALQYLSKSDYLLLSLTGVQSPRRQWGKTGRKWKKQLFAFRVTHVAPASAETDSQKAQSSLGGQGPK